MRAQNVLSPGIRCQPQIDGQTRLNFQAAELQRENFEMIDGTVRAFAAYGKQKSKYDWCTKNCFSRICHHFVMFGDESRDLERE